MPDKERRQPPATVQSSSTGGNPLLVQVRGALPGGRANARTVAALTDNPGCSRRRVIDSAGIRARELARRAGRPSQSEQSPFLDEDYVMILHSSIQSSLKKWISE